MSHVRLAAALTLAYLVVGIAGTAPAQAEFFGCNDRSGKVVSSSSWHSRASRQTSRFGGFFAPQPHQPRVIYSSAPRYSHYR